MAKESFMIPKLTILELIEFFGSKLYGGSFYDYIFLQLFSFIVF